MSSPYERRIAVLPQIDAAPITIEQKFLFDGGKKGLLLEWLELYLLRDPQSYFSPIISLYYDTPELRFYYEVRNGDYQKNKVRLRWYQKVCSPEQRTIKCFLEIKQKFGARRLKRRRELTLDPASLNGDVFSHPAFLAAPDAMPESRLLARGILMPLLVVEYERFRFIDPLSGSRIALDSGIVCSRANPAYLAAAPAAIAAGVLEVKGGLDTLPACLAPLERHLRKQSFSKYARCCGLLIDASSSRRPT